MAEQLLGGPPVPDHTLVSAKTAVITGVVSTGVVITGLASAKELNGQVCTALSLLVQGDALDKLRQFPDGAGLEAWRRIVAFYEPMNRGHKLRVLHRIMNRRCQQDRRRSRRSSYGRSM